MDFKTKNVEKRTAYFDPSKVIDLFTKGLVRYFLIKGRGVVVQVGCKISDPDGDTAGYMYAKIPCLHKWEKTKKILSISGNY